MAAGEIRKSGKVVIVGDGACGKTCFLEVFRRNQFPDKYIPTVVDNFVKEIKLDDNKFVSLALWDTAGQEDYDTIRPLSYRETDLVLICYTLESRKKIPNISKKWLMEIKKYCPSAAYFLIGLKKDIRDSDDPTVDKSVIISEAEGQNIANEIGAKKFVECSALTGENVNFVFEEAARYIFESKEAISTSNGCKFCGYC